MKSNSLLNHFRKRCWTSRLIFTVIRRWGVSEDLSFDTFVKGEIIQYAMECHHAPMIPICKRYFLWLQADRGLSPQMPQLICGLETAGCAPVGQERGGTLKKGSASENLAQQQTGPSVEEISQVFPVCFLTSVIFNGSWNTMSTQMFFHYFTFFVQRGCDNFFWQGYCLEHVGHWCLSVLSKFYLKPRAGENATVHLTKGIKL